LKKSVVSSQLRLQIAFFTFIRMVCSVGFRVVYPFLPTFRDALNVPLETLTGAIGARSLVAAFLGPLFASLGDRRGRRTGMLVGMGLFVAGSAFVVFLPNFVGFVIALILMLIGKVTFDPSMQAYIGDRIPYQQRSRTIALTELSWSGAFFIGIPVMGFVIARAGWMAPFPLVGGLILLCMLFVWLNVPKDPPHKEKPLHLSANLKKIAQTPAARAGLLFTLFSCIANEVIGLIFGVWLEASFGFQLAALSAAAAVLGIAELSGEGLVAFITDRIGKRRAILIGTAVNCVAVLLLPLFSHWLPGAVFALFLFYISFEFTIVSSIPLLTEVLPSARATMMSGFFTLASIGRALASWLTPLLYARGFGANVGASIGFNLLAVLVLGRLHLEGENK
jgi:predicted MFS family arabinose efflux permease